MALVPLLSVAPAPSGLHNIEAEHALLGILLYDNEAIETVGLLKAEHFFDPYHGRLWAMIAKTVASGRLAEPILLARLFEHDPGFGDMNGVRFFADLVEHAPPARNAPDYAREIIDLAASRDLLRVSAEIAAVASDRSLSAREKIEGAEAMLFALAESGQIEKGPRAFAEPVQAAMEMAAEAHRRDGALSGLPTGLADVDRKLGGLQASDLIVLASRPSMGKSALAMNIAVHAARQGLPVAFFSLEMSAEQLATRVIAEAADVSSDLVRKGNINEFEFRRMHDAAGVVAELGIYIDDTGALSISKLVARARRLKRQHGVALVVVDYLQLLTTDERGRGDNRVQEVTQITGALKALAKELNVPVLAVAQLSRKVEDRDDKRPHLADLRESGSIEQDADVVAFLYREVYYLSRSEPKEDDPRRQDWQNKCEDARHTAELIIAKQRHGPTGTIALHFDEDRTKFSNSARDRDYAAQSPRYAYGGARD